MKYLVVVVAAFALCVGYSCDSSDESTQPSQPVWVDGPIAMVEMRDSTVVRCDSGDCASGGGKQIDMFGHSAALGIVDGHLVVNDSTYVPPDTLGLVMRASIYYYGEMHGGGYTTVLRALPYVEWRFGAPFSLMSDDSIEMGSLSGRDSLPVRHAGATVWLVTGDSCVIVDSARYFEPSLDGTDTIRYYTDVSYRRLEFLGSTLRSEVN